MEDTLKDFWATRPRRPRRGRKLAGVAAGIGNRYGIDPTVIRVAFVVATFYGGAGILFYLLGWLMLPEQNDKAAPFESMVKHRRSSTSSAFTVLLCLALIPAFWFIFFDNDVNDSKFSGIMGLLIVSGALFLLHRTRGHLNRPDAPAPAETFSFAEPLPQPVTTAAFVADPIAPPPYEPPIPTTPPAWDPLGAAPFAWDLPEPSPPAPEPPAPRRRSKIGIFTVGAALVTAGTLAMVAPYVGGWLSPHHIVALVLAVIGLGMVGGAFLRGGRGLIGIAVPLSVVAIGLSVFSPDGFHGAGEINARPTTLEEVQDNYRLSAGPIRVDLSALPESGKVDTSVRTDAGQVIVTVPKNADVDLSCEVAAGDLDCLGHRADGLGSEVSFQDNGPDGEGGLRIELHVRVNAGTVEVRRA